MVGQKPRQHRFLQGLSQGKIKNGISTQCRMKLLPGGPDFLLPWCFNNEAVQLRQACLSGPSVQPVLCYKVATVPQRIDLQHLGVRPSLSEEAKALLKPIFVEMTAYNITTLKDWRHTFLKIAPLIANVWLYRANIMQIRSQQFEWRLFSTRWLYFTHN